jgi:hypothetical protein
MFLTALKKSFILDLRTVPLEAENEKRGKKKGCF